MTYTTQPHRFRHVLLLVLTALIAAGCQSTGSGVDRLRDSENLAQRALANAEYVDAAAIYEQLSSGATGAERRRLRLAAALAWLDAGDADRARKAAATLAPGTAADLDWQLYAAAVAATDRDWEAARATLTVVADQPLTTGQRIRYQRWWAATLYAAQEPALATSFLSRRELWLESERAVAANHQLIWNSLRDSPPEALYTALTAASDATVRGWLELVVVTNPVRTNPAALDSVVTAWTRRYSAHPANATFIPALLGGDAGDVTGTQQIALLLPLTGRSRLFATAIRDGFLAAHIQRSTNDTPQPRIRVYDVASEGVSATLRRALLEGSDLIVGPLTKTAVAELALQPALPVTTLALNRLPAETTAPGGLYQFGLAPEDEAQAAAERAIALGLTRAVALVPHGDLGERLLTSFATTFQALGGTVLDIERFEATETDFSAPIRRLLQIQASLGRRQRLQNLLGTRVEYEPRRRHDIDVLFLPASAATARLLKPQLAFHYAGNIPTFATGQIANDDGRDSSELAGIEYAEIPWLVAHSGAIEPSVDTMAEVWRSEPQIQRLYALGLDAYSVAMHLGGPISPADEPLRGPGGEAAIDSAGRIDSVPDQPPGGASGALTIDVGRVVRRRLVWSRFDGTRGVALPPLATPPREPLWPNEADRSRND